MSDNVVNVSEENFQQETSGAIPVIIDFWAEWCGPCKKVAPVLDEVAQEMPGKVKVIKVDVDNSQSLATQYQVMSIPTLIFMKDGKEIDRMVGAVSKDSLVNKINTTFA